MQLFNVRSHLSECDWTGWKNYGNNVQYNTFISINKVQHQLRRLQINIEQDGATIDVPEATITIVAIERQLQLYQYFVSSINK